MRLKNIFLAVSTVAAIVAFSSFISQPSHSATSTAIFAPVKIISACDMSTATITSTTVDVGRTSQYSIQAVYTGSPVGSIQINASNDYPCGGATNWTLAPPTAAVAVSAAGNNMWNVSYGNYNCLQVVYTKTSGSGTLNVIYGSK